jgi:predicted TIM-barrel fold metal-dependent hydrolase
MSLFQKIKDYPNGYRLFGGSLANYRRISIAMDKSPDTSQQELMEEKIPNKVFFGSDFPVFLPAYKDIMRWIKAQSLSAEFKRGLMRDNAERFFLKREFECEVTAEYAPPQGATVS